MNTFEKRVSDIEAAIASLVSMPSDFTMARSIRMLWGFVFALLALYIALLLVVIYRVSAY